MNKEEIKEYLPHREPMLLVDEMEMIDEATVKGYYHVKGDEFFLEGHFPGHPVVPGVILCEIMGQCSALLIKDELKGRTTFFTGIDKTRFKSPVFPGDTVEVTAQIVNKRGLLFFIHASASVNGKLAAEGTLSVTLIDNDKLKTNE